MPKSSHTAWRCCTLVNSAASLTISCYNFIKSASLSHYWHHGLEWLFSKNTDRIFTKDIPVLTVCIMEYSMLPLTQHDHFCLQGIRRSNQKYKMKLFCLSFLSLKISFFFYYKLTDVSEKLIASGPGGATRRAELFFPAEAEKVLYQMAGLFVQAEEGNSPTSNSLNTCSLSELRLDWRPHCGFTVKEEKCTYILLWAELPFIHWGHLAFPPAPFRYWLPTSYCLRGLTHSLTTTYSYFDNLF